MPLIHYVIPGYYSFTICEDTLNGEPIELQTGRNSQGYELRIRADSHTVSFAKVDAPVDFIAAWRAVEILKHYDYQPTDDELLVAYFAASRDAGDNKLFVNGIATVIGKDTFQDIMGLKVPKVVIDSIFEANIPQVAGRVSVKMGAIENEVRAGTVEWEERFDTVGLIHPNVRDEQTRQAKAIIESYSSLLWLGRFPMHAKREVFRSCLLHLEKAGVRQEHGKETAIMVAYVLAERASQRPGIGLYTDRREMLKKQTEFTLGAAAAATLWMNILRPWRLFRKHPSFKDIAALAERYHK